MNIFDALLQYNANLKIIPTINRDKCVKVTLSNNEYTFSSFIEVDMFSAFFTEVIQAIVDEFVKEMRLNE